MQGAFLCLFVFVFFHGRSAEGHGRCCDIAGPNSTSHSGGIEEVELYRGYDWSHTDQSRRCGCTLTAQGAE